jgi:hypothetical protein
MKNRPLLAAASLVVVSAIAHALFAADTASPPAAKPAINAEFVDPNAPDVADIRGVAEKAINKLVTELVNELARTIARGGLEAAVDVAHLKNLPTTGGRVTGLPRIKAIKLTSFRVRNPANAPDEADQLALDRVLKELASDYGASKLLVQRIETPNAPPEWRVYSPVGAMSTCLKCHGDPELQLVGLRDKLNAQYPTDQATGYRIGEWRGLLRVTVDTASPPPPPPPPPTKPTPKKT